MTGVQTCALPISSISASVVPGRAVRLTHIMGCLSAKEIGRIEARYK